MVERNEFITKLKDSLKMLPQEDIDNAVSYYEEYFDEAGKDKEQDVIKELGNPSAVASKIVGEYSMKEIKEIKTEKKQGSGLKILWIVLLAVFASPIALPIAIAIAAVLFSLVAVVFSLFFVFWAVGIALVASSIACFVASVAAMFTHFPTGLFFLGFSIISICIGIAFIMVGWWTTRTCFNIIVNAFAKLLVRRGSK